MTETDAVADCTAGPSEITKRPVIASSRHDPCPQPVTPHLHGVVETPEPQVAGGLRERAPHHDQARDQGEHQQQHHTRHRVDGVARRRRPVPEPITVGIAGGRHAHILQGGV